MLAISAQDVPSHEKFSSKHGGFEFPLLADTDKSVAAAYGILGPIGFPRRSVFIVDRDGTIRYAHRAIAGLTYRPVSELVERAARTTPRGADPGGARAAQFTARSSGAVASHARRPGWRRRTVRHRSSG